MSAAQPKSCVTPDDLLTMPDGDFFELVDGVLVEKPMGWEASYVASQILFLLQQHVRQHDLGWPISEGSYQCFTDDPNRVRIPDVSFVAKERMPGSRIPVGHCTVAPDLAVEVISPTNTFSGMGRKVQEYLAAGVSVVWVVDPPSKTIHVFHPNESNVRLLRESDTLEGSGVLDGFRCAVREVFETPEMPADTN